MYASNMKILTLNTNNTSPTAQGGGGTQATAKEIHNVGSGGSTVGGSGGSSGSNHKSNKREQKHSRTKFLHGNSNKTQQHITHQQQQQPHQQQKYHHSNNNSNNGGNKLKKQHYNNSNNNTTSSLNRKKFYQQQQQHHQQQHHYQQQQQYLSAMQQTICTTPTTTTITNNNSSLAENQNYTNNDLLMQQQQQRNINNTTNNLIRHNTSLMKTCTCLLQSNNCDKLTLSTCLSASSSSTATGDYHRQPQQLHTINYDNHLKSSTLSSNSTTSSASVQQPIISTASSSCISCLASFTKLAQQQQQQQATSTNFKLTNTSNTSNLKEFVAATVASKNNSNQNSTRTSTSASTSSETTTTSNTTTSSSLISAATKKKSYWKNSNTSNGGSGAGVGGSGGISASLTSSGYSTGRSTTQSPKLSKGKNNVSDKNLLTNTDSNRQPLGKSSNNIVPKYSTTVAANINTNQQKLISKNQVDRIAMNTSVTGSSGAASIKSISTSKSNNCLSKTSATIPNQQQDTLEKLNSNSDTSKSNSLGSTTTSTTTSAPTSPNSYTLDFLHSVGVKMTGVTVRSSGVQGSTNVYGNQSSTNSPVYSSYTYTGMATNQRQPRYLYGGTNTNSGGGGNHHHHQPSPLTIASFLQKDLLGPDNVISNTNSGISNSPGASSSNSRSSNSYNEQQQQQQQHYTQQQPPTHARYHHNYYATPYHQQSTGLQHTNYGGGGTYGGELTRLVTNGGGGGQRNSSYGYTNYHNATADGGVGKHNSMPQQLQNNVATYAHSLNNSQANKKSSYASSTTSNCSTSSSKSNSSNSSNRQLPALANQETNKSSSNLNLAIETLPSKTLGVGNQRGNHRGHHNNHHSHHHQNHHGHHNQHSMMNSPNMLQHQNFYNLTYVSTDGAVSGAASRGCSPAPQSLPPTPVSATNSHSPKALENSPGPVAMLMNFNTSHLQYPRYANTHQQLAVQQQQQFHQFQQQQQTFLTKKMLAPLTLAMPSPSPSPTPPTNTASTSLNTLQAAPPPHNIICCSQLDEATTAAAAAAATSSSTSGVIAGNDYDSDTPSNHSSGKHKYHSLKAIKSSLSSSSSSSSASTTSLSLMAQQAQQQNCSHPTTPAACGPATPLHSPLEYNYSGATTHVFSNLQVSQQLAPSHTYKSSNETSHLPQMYGNNGNGVISLLNLPTKSPSGYTDDDYQQQQLPQHQFYFNTPAGQTSADNLNIASTLTAVANRSNGIGGYWSPSHHNNQFLYQQTSSAQVATSSSSCGSSSASISPRLLNDEIQQTQQQLLHGCCITSASSSPTSSASCLSEQFGNIIVGSSSNADSGMLLTGSNLSSASTGSINSTNGGHNYKKGSSQLLATQQQRLIAQQTYQSSSSSTSSLSGSSASTLTSAVRARGGGGGGGINTNNGRTNQMPLSKNSITTSGGPQHMPLPPPPPPPTQHFYSHHQQQLLPPPLPPHNLLYNNPQTHHMRALSSSSISSSVHDFFTHTPPDRFLARAHLVEAKEEPATLLNNSKWDHLSQCIWKKFISSQQTEETFKQKMRLWRFLYLFIKNAYPRYGLYLVGSTISGFGSDSSDVDMCLVSRSASSIDPRMEALFNLTVLRDCLSKSGEFENFNLIEAKVPILRFRDRINQLEVDLNFNNCVGIKNTHLLYCYSQLDWRLRPLVLVTKLWAQYHNINNAKNMTISSYSLVLMVIHFLQYAVNPPILPCLHDIFPDKFPLLRSNDFGYVDMNETIGPYESKNTQTIGELFLYFLEYYSYFDYTQYAISIRTGGLLPINVCRTAKSLKNDVHQWKELCIEEPFDLTNTARSVYDFETFERVKAVFVASWRVLQETLDLNSVFSTIIIPSPCSTGSSALTNTTTTTVFNEIEADVVSDTKNHLEQYVNMNSTLTALGLATTAAVENHEHTSIEEEFRIDISGVDGTDECDNNITATNNVTTIAISTISTTQKMSKRKDLNHTLTPRQIKIYDEKEFPATLSQTQKSPVSSSSSLTCIKTSTKNVNRNNSNKTTTTPIKS